MKTKRIVFSFLMVLVGIILVYPFVDTIRMSMVDYRLISGLENSPSVGMQHYKDFFESVYFDRLFSNTIAISSVALLIGAVYTFFASSAITATKNVALRFFLTFIFCIPALIPGILIANMLRSPETSPLATRFYIGVFDGLRLSSFVVFASGFASGKPWKEGFKFALVFVAIRLITLFTTDSGMLLNIYRETNYEHLDTFNTFTFRWGIGAGDYSFSSAVDVIRIMLQFIPAIIGCVLLVLAFRKKSEPEIKSNSGWLGASAMTIVPASIFILLLMTGSSVFPMALEDNSILNPYYVNEFIITFLSAFFATAIAYGISVICREANRIVGMIALTLAILTTGCLTTDFMNVRESGLLDGYLGVVMMNMSIVPVLAIVFTFIAKDMSGVKKHFGLVAGGFAFSFAWFWGSFLSPAIILTDSDKLPLSLYIRKILIESRIDEFMGDGGITDAGAYMLATTPKPLSSLLYILIPIVIASVGILVGHLLSKRKSGANYTHSQQ